MASMLRLARFPHSGVLLLAAALFASAATAGSTYLNGVNIDGVTGVKFEKATVRIDNDGNIFIDAPGYKVVQSTEPVAQTPPPQGGTTATASAQQQQQQAPQGPIPTRITKRYWLVVKQTAPGMTEFDVDVYVNAKWLMTVKNAMADDAIDITRHLSPGQNTVVFEAKKVTSGPRKSYSTEHAISLVIGEGNEASGNVMVDNALVTFRRTAQDGEGIAKEYSFVAR